MVIFKHAGMAGLVALLSMGGAFAADETAAPSSGPRAHMKCTDTPEKCREAMQEKAAAWWKKVDTDADGSVSREEAKANAPRLSRDFDKVDANVDGKVTREELEAAGKDGRQARAKKWWEKVDADHDGSISREEATANAPRLAKNFDRVDADHDGKVTPDELKAARKK